MSESPNAKQNAPALSKEEKKAAKAAAKAAKAEAKAAAAAARDAEVEAKRQAEIASIASICGMQPLNQSVSRAGREYAEIDSLDESSAGKKVLLRARLHSVRSSGNIVFAVMRQKAHTLQAILVKSDETPKAMLKFVGQVSAESIIDIEGTLRVPEQSIEAATCSKVELAVTAFFVVSQAQTPLPFALADAMTPEPEVKAYLAKLEDIKERLSAARDALEGEADSAEKKEQVTKLEAELEAASAECRPVSRPNRLDNRVVDLRTPANQAIFRIQSGVCRLFRAHLSSLGFTEIQTPKLIGCLSEGGANVFEVSYFGKKAYLAQSPQFYKQMMIASDFDRVFEVAPVFRAEDSNTPRHMTEFIGLDMEMTFKEHYHEVLEVLDGLFEAIFEGLRKEHEYDIQVVSQQYPVEPFKTKFPSPLVTFEEGVEMLTANGIEQSRFEDLSTENERVLGRLVKEKYDTDFYRLDKFPADARPFYTMLDAKDERVTNSYDFMMRGQEILSGAQRVHDHAMLLERAKVKEVDLDSVTGYTDSFKYGVPPHAGGGVGLNRVTMLFLGLGSIQQSTLFPRLPKRLYP